MSSREHSGAADFLGEGLDPAPAPHLLQASDLEAALQNLYRLLESKGFATTEVTDPSTNEPARMWTRESAGLIDVILAADSRSALAYRASSGYIDRRTPFTVPDKARMWRAFGPLLAVTGQLLELPDPDNSRRSPGQPG